MKKIKYFIRRVSGEILNRRMENGWVFDDNVLIIIMSLIVRFWRKYNNFGLTLFLVQALSQCHAIVASRIVRYRYVMLSFSYLTVLSETSIKQYFRFYFFNI